MLENFEKLFREEIKKIAGDDPAHDLLHFQRVVATAKKLAQSEKADMNIVVPAAWLHDYVIVPKDSPLRSQASRMSAQKATQYLQDIQYPLRYIDDIAHCIEAHSFSAGILPQSLEAKIVQDADRLDGLGAIGLARCFATAGLLKRSFYEGADPFCTDRAYDDSLYTIDHFYVKLFKTAEMLQTASARTEGKRRADVMRRYLIDLSAEIA